METAPNTARLPHISATDDDTSGSSGTMLVTHTRISFDRRRPNDGLAHAGEYILGRPAERVVVRLVVMDPPPPHAPAAEGLSTAYRPFRPKRSRELVVEIVVAEQAEESVNADTAREDGPVVSAGSRTTGEVRVRFHIIRNVYI